MRMVLPILVVRENKLTAGVLLFAATAILYLTPNHYHIFKPRLLPLTRVDAVVPFIPQTVWLYVSEYLYLAVIYWSYKNLQNLNRFIYAFLSLQAGCVIVFWLWPTAISRGAFPIPASLDPVTRLILTVLRRADSPTNCFPSFHVGSVYLSCLLISSEERPKFYFFLVWSTAISLSTLTLKQHYFVDVVSGFCLAVILFLVFRRTQFVKSGGKTADCSSPQGHL